MKRYCFFVDKMAATEIITTPNHQNGVGHDKGTTTLLPTVKQVQADIFARAMNGSSADITFAEVAMGVVDPDEVLLRKLRADTSPEKVDLVAGVYRSERGTYYEFEVIRKAKQILAAKDLGHDVSCSLHKRLC